MTYGNNTESVITHFLVVVTKKLFAYAFLPTFCQRHFLYPDSHYYIRCRQEFFCGSQQLMIPLSEAVA